MADGRFTFSADTRLHTPGIGPSSFALDTVRPVQALDKPGAPRAQVGMQGGGAADTGRTAAYIPDNTESDNLDLLAKLGGDLLEPALKKAQQDRFYEGMRRAANGEAAKDIANEQPEWSRSFGDSDVAMGARTYEGAAKSANVEAAIISNMPTLAKMSGADFQKHMQDVVASQYTGDPGVDQTIDRNFLQFLPQALKTHAKANWEYQQRDAERQRSDYIGGSMKLFGTTDAAYRGSKGADGKGQVSDEEYAAAKAKALSMLVPAPGENQDTREKAVVVNLYASMSNGDLAFASLLRNTVVDSATGRTAWDLLPAAELDRLNAMYQSQGTKVQASTLTEDEQKAIAAMYNMPAGVDITPYAKKINDDIRARTGVDLDFLSPRQIAQEIKANAAKAAAEAAREAKAERRHRESIDAQNRAAAAQIHAIQYAEKLKRTEDDRKVALAVGVSSSEGNAASVLSDLIHVGAVTRETLSRGQSAAWDTPPSEQWTASGKTLAQYRAHQVNTAASAGQDHVVLKGLVASTFSATGDLGKGGATVLNLWKDLSEEARTKNFTPQQRSTMELYQTELALQADNKKDPNLAFAMARAKANVAKAREVNKDTTSRIAGAIDDLGDVPAGARRFIMGQATRNLPLDGFGTGTPKDEAAAVQATLSNIPRIGDFWAVETQPGAFPPWSSLVHGGASKEHGVQPPEFSAAARRVVAAKYPDVDFDDALFLRVGPRHWAADVLDKEGRTRQVLLDIPSIQAEITKGYQKQRHPGKPKFPAADEPFQDAGNPGLTGR